MSPTTNSTTTTTTTALPSTFEVAKSIKNPTEISVPLLPLEPDMYDLTDEEIAFFKKLTGIDDEGELKKHILDVQGDAYKVHPYPCIRQFGFLMLKISLHPAYTVLLEKGKEPGATLLDIGCCFGNDPRKAALDGFPADRIIASDLRGEFWDLGHRLFNDTPSECKIKFTAGNALDDDFLDMSSYVPYHTNKGTGTAGLSTSTNGHQNGHTTNEIGILAPPNLASVTSLTQLQGKLTCIHAAALFHLFDSPTQLSLAHRLSTLLSPTPGSFIFGSHGGMPTESFRPAAGGIKPMFCHSPESWRKMWDGEVFERGSVRVDVELEKWDREHKWTLEREGGEFWQLVWRVTRV